MAKHLFKKGQAPGPGRPKDSISRRSLQFADVMIKAGFDPAKGLIEAYNNAKHLYETALDPAMKATANGQMLLAADKMAPYVYPKLSSIEVKKENHLDKMTPKEKLEAMKQAIKMLESEVENSNNEPELIDVGK